MLWDLVVAIAHSRCSGGLEHEDCGAGRFEVVARRSGLGTTANLRTLMRRATGITPSAYKRRFGPEAN